MAKADKAHRADRDGAQDEGRRHRAGGGSPKARTAAKTPREHWKEEPDDHDYPAAHDYLSLLLGDADALHIVKGLEGTAVTRRKAKDLLRASRLALLDSDDPEVTKDLRKVRRGERLSPVLLVRGALGADVAMTVADGYHRICASYHLNEDADIPCRIAEPPTRSLSAAPSRRAPGRGAGRVGPQSR